MRFDVSKWTRLAVLGLVSASFASTGCSSASGWKMPGSKMFSWSKKPSETTLAGAGPSAIKYPESPASKQTPQTIASAAAGTGSNKSTLASTGLSSSGFPQSGTSKATTPTYTPPNGMSNVAFAPPGAAAAANGYSVGPYNTYSQPGAAANALASAGVPNGVGGMSAPGMAPSNPYNNPALRNGLPSTQTYAANNAMVTGAGKPNPQSIANLQAPANSAFPSTPGGMTGMSNPMSNPAGTSASFAAAGSNPNAGFAASGPMSTGTPGFSLPQSMPATAGGYSPVGTAGNMGSQGGAIGGSFASSPSGTLPTNGLPSTGNTQIPSGVSNVPAQMATYNAQNAGSNLSTASFRPGSTGRQTNYNFAQPSTNNAVAGQGFAPPTGGQATSTATGTNNPGFQVPPATTYR